MTPAADQIATLTQRRNWLTARIAAKQQVGWEHHWDERERDALSWALDRLNAGDVERGAKMCRNQE